MGLVWSDIVKQAALSTTLAMAWETQDHRYPARNAIHVRDAGFKGLVGYHPDTLAEQADEGMREPRDPYSHWDEDIRDKSAPEAAPHEQAHLDGHGEPHEDYERRHDHAYEKLWHEHRGEGNPDHHDDDLMNFVSHHTNNPELWKEKGTFGPVDLRKGVYATQSHVHPNHFSRYLSDPHAPTERTRYRDEDSLVSDEPWREHLADRGPMFVTHQGRLHATEGHHRVAAALQRGDSHINGWHYDADHHGFPANHDEDDDDHWGS